MKIKDHDKLKRTINDLIDEYEEYIYEDGCNWARCNQDHINAKNGAKNKADEWRKKFKQLLG